MSDQAVIIQEYFETRRELTKLLFDLRDRGYVCNTVLMSVCDLMMEFALSTQVDVVGVFLTERCVHALAEWRMKRLSGPVC